MSVTFELDIPPRSPQPDFTAPPVPASGLVAGEDRRHRELLAALQDLTETVEEIEAPAVTVAPAVTAGPDVTVAAALLADGVEKALAESARMTTEALSEVVERLKTLSRQVIASAGGPSGGGGSVMVRNDTSNPVPVTLTNPTSTVAVSNFYESLALTAAVGAVSPGSPLVITPSSGKRLRIWRVIASADPDNSATGRVTATMAGAPTLAGDGVFYRAYALGFVQKVEGSTEAPCTIASPDAGTYEVTVHYEEF